ncbi:MAG: pyrroline-5-carboxylate reductase, partial [Nitrospirae bacterium]|nr:pyrroline-5-carboxylate reductase [Nitrospirota bacterium]
MIGFIGGGNMAGALIKGLISTGVKDIIVSEPDTSRCNYLIKEFGVIAVSDNKKAASTSDILILAVKPQIIKGILDEIKGSLNDNTIIVSIAAGITLSLLKKKLMKQKIVRIMPNTPALVLEAMSVISFSEGMSIIDQNEVIKLFKSAGKVLVLPENQMNAVTALSGSGPAFIAYFTQAMIQGGITQGLDE